MGTQIGIHWTVNRAMALRAAGERDIANAMKVYRSSTSKCEALYRIVSAS
jgi:hypothetical protein